VLFSEEMAVLSERFREVTVTLAEPAKLPARLPATWLQAGQWIVWRGCG